MVLFWLYWHVILVKGYNMMIRHTYVFQYDYRVTLANTFITWHNYLLCVWWEPLISHIATFKYMGNSISCSYLMCSRHLSMQYYLTSPPTHRSSGCPPHLLSPPLVRMQIEMYVREDIWALNSLILINLRLFKVLQVKVLEFGLSLRV